MITLSSQDLEKLTAIHPDLAKVVDEAAKLSMINFIVIQGLRSVEEEKADVAKGTSTTLHSRHLDGHAVDLGVLADSSNVDWDISGYATLNQVMQQAATNVGVPIEWGGNWVHFKDWDHWQLPWAQYPSDMKVYAFIDDDSDDS